MRGTHNRRAYELLRMGALAMTFPIRSDGKFIEAYCCFANALIEDHVPGSAPADPSAGFDDGAFKKARANSKYWRAFSWLSYCLIAAWLEDVRDPDGAPEGGDVPFGDRKIALDFAETGERLCIDQDPDLTDRDNPRPTDYVVPWVLGFFHMHSLGRNDPGRPESKKLALDYYREAIALNGDNNVNLISEFGEALIGNDQYDDALTTMGHAIRTRPWYRLNAAWAYYNKGRFNPDFYRSALAELRKIESVVGDTEFPGEVFLVAAATYYRLGMQDKAKRAIESFKAEKTGWDLPNEVNSVDYLEPDARAHWIDAITAVW